MSKIFKRFFVLFSFCFILYPLLSYSTAAEKDPQKKLTLVKKELIEINQSLKKKRQEKNRHTKKIKSFDLEISNLNKKLNKIQANKKSAHSKIQSLKVENKSLLKKIEENQNNLSELTRAVYMLGGESHLKRLLSSSNAEQQSRMRTYYNYFHQAFVEQQEQLASNMSRLTELEVALAQKVSEYDQLLMKYEKQNKAFREKRKNKKQYLAKLDKQIKSKKDRVRALKSSRKTLQKLLKALEKRKHREKMEAMSGMSFAKYKGRLKWPVQGKVRFKYGQARANSGLKWRGMLISAKTGASVKAVDNGTVVFSDWLSGYGFVLILDHGKGYMSLYGHNQQLLKDVGEKVKVGEKIAEAGNSGRLGKPGLYFEIRRNGKPINPAKWMMAKKGR